VEVRGRFVRVSSLSVKKEVLHDLTNGVGAIAPPNPVAAIKSLKMEISSFYGSLVVPSME
jgi:hypothetical protein